MSMAAFDEQMEELFGPLGHHHETNAGMRDDLRTSPLGMHALTRRYNRHI